MLEYEIIRIMYDVSYGLRPPMGTGACYWALIRWDKIENLVATPQVLILANLELLPPIKKPVKSRDLTNF
jgi:hypothetical protein